MKKIYSFLAIILCSMLFAGYTWATDYNLWIAGVQVTDANKSSITGTGISGKVSYNPNTSTLTLENATISHKRTAININAMDISILLIGKNILTSTSESAIYTSSSSSLTIKGNGSADLISKDRAISVADCELIIDSTTLTATGSIAGNIGGEKLSIKNSTVKVTSVGSGVETIYQFSKIVLEGCEITKPSGAVIDGGAVKLNGSVVTEDVVIEPVIYDLTVAGVQVSSVNASNITGECISGKVSYSAATNTLTLENAIIAATERYVMGISNYIENLKINLIGSNKIDVGQLSAIFSNKNISIVGSGSLEANSTQEDALDVKDGNLTIEGVTITATGDYWGIRGSFEREMLSIKNATVKATGRRGSICYFKEIKLEGCILALPSGAVIDGGTVKLNGGIVMEEVVIRPSGAGVQETMSDNVRIRMQNRQLTVENSAREAIAVYNIMGQVVATKQNPNNTETFILPAAGVYIVRVGMGATRIVTL